MGARVLVVDDDPSIVRAVAANLRVRGYEPLTAASGETALAVVDTDQPDCIVLDLGLPGIDGLEVLRRLRTWTLTPVVILTAMDGERDKATALDLGADDYITKPFGMAELLARVGVALRHGQGQDSNGPRRVTAGAVQVDLDARLVTRDGQPVSLTQTEYRLLEVPRPTQAACAPTASCSNASGTRLPPGGPVPARRDGRPTQQADDAPAPELLVTEPGVGYRLSCQTEASPGPAPSTRPAHLQGLREPART
jgi:two-component system, OmpR family, KDP operon response regulator KdpE